MLKNKSTKGPQLSYAAFEARHQRELTEASDLLGSSTMTFSVQTSLKGILAVTPRSPLPNEMRKLKSTSFFRLLAAAGRENCPDAFNALLYLWLHRLGVRIPAGVFLEPRGRP